MDYPLEPAAGAEVGNGPRGTPRVRQSFVAARSATSRKSKGTGTIDLAIAQRGLARLGVDALGLDTMDRALLDAIIGKIRRRSGRARNPGGLHWRRQGVRSRM